MSRTPSADPRSDAALVAAFLERGDRSAFAAIYDRYADSLYDTAVVLLRDRDEAADAMQDVFVTAAQRLGQLRDPSRLRAWLFAVLRNDVYRRSARRQRQRPTDPTAPGAFDVAAVRDPHAEGDAVIAAELAAVVDGAAGGLDDRDRMVLQLSVRQGLSGSDLAAALGVTPEQSHVLVHRMRERVERSLGAYLVARRGRSDCADLAELLRSWNGTFDVLTRKRVARHVDQCAVCDTTRRKWAVVPLLGATPALAAPIELRERILGRIDAAGGFPGSDGRNGSGFVADADGFPVDDRSWPVGDDDAVDGPDVSPIDVVAGDPESTHRRRRGLLLVAAAVVLFGVLATSTALLVRRDDGTSVAGPVPSGTPASSLPPEAAPPASVSPVPASSASVPSVPAVDDVDPFVRPATPANPTTAPPPTAPPPTTAPSVTDPPSTAPPPTPPRTTSPPRSTTPTVPPTAPPTIPPTAPPTAPPTVPPTAPPTAPPTNPTTTTTVAPVPPPSVSLVRVVTSLTCRWTVDPLLVVRVTSTAPLSTVRVRWSGPVRGSSTAMTTTGSGVWQANLRIPAVNGTWTWTVTATDTSGGVGSLSAPIVVSGC
jgi:RNA polymerase sigma factor (sigma-70 family)